MLVVIVSMCASHVNVTLWLCGDLQNQIRIAILNTLDIMLCQMESQNWLFYSFFVSLMLLYSFGFRTNLMNDSIGFGWARLSVACFLFLSCIYIQMNRFAWFIDANVLTHLTIVQLVTIRFVWILWMKFLFFFLFSFAFNINSYITINIFLNSKYLLFDRMALAFFELFVQIMNGPNKVYVCVK